MRALCWKVAWKKTRLTNCSNQHAAAENNSPKKYRRNLRKGDKENKTKQKKKRGVLKGDGQQKKKKKEKERKGGKQMKRVIERDMERWEWRERKIDRRRERVRKEEGRKRGKKRACVQATTSPVQSSWVWLHNNPSINYPSTVIPPFSHTHSHTHTDSQKLTLIWPGNPHMLETNMGSSHSLVTPTHSDAYTYTHTLCTCHTGMLQLNIKTWHISFHPRYHVAFPHTSRFT